MWAVFFESLIGLSSSNDKFFESWRKWKDDAADTSIKTYYTNIKTQWVNLLYRNIADEELEFEYPLWETFSKFDWSIEV